SNDWYYYSRGVQEVNTWKKINKKWYYFDENGKMKIGWHFDSKVNHWYYLNPNGDMKTGWLKYSNKWYYFRPCGKMAELSWVKYKGQMYYFGIFGYMRTDAWIEGFPEEVKIDLDKYAREGMFYPRYYVDREGKYRPTAKESFKGEIGQW
ncbi:hypothetical protein DM690_25405, partial [Salmonella enterica subsp. enterica serovar Tamberma]|nr:hypothetical protein [Salmonella enterica subsp. enterica serovar Tamberma]